MNYIKWYICKKIYCRKGEWTIAIFCKTLCRLCDELFVFYLKKGVKTEVKDIRKLIIQV